MADAPVAIVILAAGQSCRMRGSDKMLELVAGQPLIRHQALKAMATGQPVWVALPPDRPFRAEALDGLQIGRISVVEAALGLSHSIRAANAAVPPEWAVMFWLADLPEIETSDLILLLEANRMSPQVIVRATTQSGKMGHPVLFPPRFRADLNSLTGDEGARDILKRLAGETACVPLAGNRALTDLDTPEDWVRWRAGQANQG